MKQNYFRSRLLLMACLVVLGICKSTAANYNLIWWPLNANNADSTAARAVGVVPTVPYLNKLVVSNGTTVAFPAYSSTFGMSYDVTGAGAWTNNAPTSGPGGTPKKDFYTQFTFTGITGDSLRVDSVILNTGCNSVSATKLACWYSLSNFVSDSTNVTAGLDTLGNPLVSAGTIGLFPTYFGYGTQSGTGTNTQNWRFALNGAAGVKTGPAGTITFRIYNSCSSSSTSGRFWFLKDVIAKGEVLPTALPCVAPTLSTAITNAGCTNNGAVALTTTGGTSPFTYSWTGPNSFTATTKDLASLAPGTYNVTVTATGNCTATTSAVVGANTTFTATATAQSSTSFCPGGNVVLKANTGTGFTYLWKNGTTTIPGATDSTYNATAAGTYSVLVSSGTNCSATSAGIAVTLNAKPTSSATSTGTSFCTGSSLTLTGPSTTGLTYQWQLNGANIPTATSSTYSAAAAGNYRLTVTNASSCSDTSSVLTITTNPLPTAVITPAGTTTFCTGSGSVVLNATAATGTSYVWKQGSTVLGSTTAAYTATASGSYTVTITNTTTNCSATSSPIVVTVGAPPSSAVTPSAATAICQGSSVKLRTNNGAGLTYQWYNGATAINLATDSTYTATALGSYSVTVSAGIGCASTSAATVITVNAKPTSAATAAATAFCAGGSTLLTGPSTTGLTYQWQLNAANIPTATSSTYSASATGNYRLTVTNASGCSDTSAALAITSNPLPTAVITPASATTFCNGSVVLNATVATGNSYVWKQGSTILASTTSSYTATTSGSYTVTITNTATTCSATSSAVVVTASSVPTAVVTPASAATICQGTTLRLKTNSAAGLTYQWYNGTNIIALATDSFYNATAAGSYSVVITGAGAGCTSTSTATAITVNAKPTAYAAATAATTFCAGGAVLLKDTVGTGITYQWQKNGANLSGETNANYNATTSGNYRIYVTNTSGCSDTSSIIAVTAIPLPTAVITPAGPSSICSYDSVILSIPSIAGYTYQWVKDTTNITGATSFRYAAKAAGAYKLIVSNSGCTSTSSPTVVNVNAAPAATISPAGNVSVCTGENVVMNTTFGTGLTYQWMQGGNAISGATTSTYTTNVAGSFSVTIANLNGCVATTPTPSVITMIPLPAPVIAYDTLIGNLTTGTFATYQWYLNNSPIPGATAQNYFATKTGTYSVVVTATGCGNKSADFIVTSLASHLGINGASLKDAVHIYPNPAVANVSVVAPVAVTVSICSMEGKTILQITDTKTIDISALADGMYMIRISDKNGAFIKMGKLLKTSH